MITCVKPDGYVSHPYCCRRVCHETEIDTYRNYLWCLECGHPYRTRWHLLFAFLAVGRRHGASWLTVLGSIRRPSRIFCCQCCSHDF